MSEQTLASGGSEHARSDKPRVTLEQLRWLQAFHKIKAMPENTELAGWQIHWVHEDPNWIELKRKKESKMVRYGDPFIHELLR